MLKATVISPQEPGPRLIALVSEQGRLPPNLYARLIDGADPAGEGTVTSGEQMQKHQSL